MKTKMNINRIKKIAITLISAMTFVMTLGMNFSFAQMPPINPTDEKILIPGADSPSTQGQNALQNKLLPNITNIVIGLTGGLSLLFVIIGALQILTAFGSDDKIGAGKKTLTWAIAGLVISMLSYAIVQVVTSINLTPPK